MTVEFSAARFESNINKQSRKRVVMLREGRMSVKLAEMEALLLFEFFSRPPKLVPNQAKHIGLSI